MLDGSDLSLSVHIPVLPSRFKSSCHEMKVAVDVQKRLPSGSDFLQLLEYYILQPSEYQFLVCRLYGDYPAKECHL